MKKPIPAFALLLCVILNTEYIAYFQNTDGEYFTVRDADYDYLIIDALGDPVLTG